MLAAAARYSSVYKWSRNSFFFLFLFDHSKFYSNGGSLSSVDTSPRAHFLHNVLPRSIIDSFRKFLDVLGRFEELVAFSLISLLLISLGKAIV